MINCREVNWKVVNLRDELRSVYYDNANHKGKFYRKFIETRDNITACGCLSPPP